MSLFWTIIVSGIGTAIPLAAVYYVAYTRGLKRGVQIGVRRCIDDFGARFAMGQIMFRRPPPSSTPLDAKHLN